MHLIHLTYVSKLHIDTVQDFAVLATQSTANNRRAEITGFLVLAGGYAFQVLEGARESVSRTFNRLAKDRRHSNVTICLSEDISDRYFPNSAMTVVDASISYPEIIESYQIDGRLQPAKMTGHLIWDMVARVADEAGKGMAGGLRASMA